MYIIIIIINLCELAQRLVKDIMPLVDDGEFEEQYKGVQNVVEIVVAVALLPVVGAI